MPRTETRPPNPETTAPTARRCEHAPPDHPETRPSGARRDGHSLVLTPPIDHAGAPASVTFYMTRAQRADTLRALRRVHPDRDAALRIALGLAPRPAAATRRRQPRD